MNFDLASFLIGFHCSFMVAIIGIFLLSSHNKKKWYQFLVLIVWEIVIVWYIIKSRSIDKKYKNRTIDERINDLKKQINKENEYYSNKMKSLDDLSEHIYTEFGITNNKEKWIEAVNDSHNRVMSSYAEKLEKLLKEKENEKIS